ncbi:hypothetical protein BJEO58_00792 [Brevibacterium jeotgali]|uniref:Uncharacterized protein n=1 Tax=Brevibacterium jeotgali TaxID=1262550 RepID=A0A2H1L308_9MICO|nr:hypothetical protein BJEO58_00792 [Brevibacterium jeotgali]
MWRAARLGMTVHDPCHTGVLLGVGEAPLVPKCWDWSAAGAGAPLVLTLRWGSREASATYCREVGSCPGVTIPAS